MLDNSDHQRLQERIAEVAAFLPGPGAPCHTSPGGDAAADCPPFSKHKVERILDRVYDRLCREAGETDDPQLRQFLAQTLAHPEGATAFSEAKTLRILAHVEARLAADAPAVAKSATDANTKPPRRASALAKLRSAASALFLLRHLSFEARLLSDPRGPRPLTDGPTE